ncbi:unnamed protein product, partial [Phaeothamnion confervicola]
SSDVTTGLQWIDTPCLPHHESGEMSRDACLVGHFPYRSLLADTDSASSAGGSAGDGGSGSGEGRPDAPTAVLGAWQHVVTCARDGVVRLHSLARAYKPRDYVSPVAMGVSAAAGLAQVHDGVDRSLEALRIYRDERTDRGLGVFCEPPEPTGLREVPAAGSRSPHHSMQRRRASGADILDDGDSPTASPKPASWGGAGAAMTGMWLGQPPGGGSWGAGASPTLLGGHGGSGNAGGGGGAESPQPDGLDGVAPHPRGILQTLSPAPLPGAAVGAVPSPTAAAAAVTAGALRAAAAGRRVSDGRAGDGVGGGGIGA